MLLRVTLTVVLIAIAFVAGGMGIFAPMLGDDPRNTGVAVTVFCICAAVVLACGLGIFATWWKR